VGLPVYIRLVDFTVSSRGVTTGWTVVDMFTRLLADGVPDIDVDQVIGGGVGQAGSLPLPYTDSKMTMLTRRGLLSTPLYRLGDASSWS